MWAGVACGYGLSVGEFKNLVPRYLSGKELLRDLIILKSFRFLIFKTSGTCQKLSQNEFWREENFKTLAVPVKLFFNSNCSHQSSSMKLLPPN